MWVAVRADRSAPAPKLPRSEVANTVNPLTYLIYILGEARNKSITLQTPDEFTASNIAHVG